MKIDELGIHVHQSDLDGFIECQESTRRRLLIKDDSEFESDAATVGTVLHATIEHDIDEPFATEFDAEKYAAWLFVETLEGYVKHGNTVYSRSSFKSDKDALDHLIPLVRSWYRSPERVQLMLYPREELHTEWVFDRPFISRGGKKQEIYLAGHADLVFDNTIWDWKSSAGLYSWKQWEKQRWDVQSTVYLWAAQDAGLIIPNHRDEFVFKFKVFERNKQIVTPHTVEVTRTMQSFEWLKHQIVTMVEQIERLPKSMPWMLGDHSALCSPKWCPFWSDCKGKFVNPDKGWK